MVAAGPLGCWSPPASVMRAPSLGRCWTPSESRGRADRGRPRKRPAHLVADRGYSHPSCRRLLRQRRIAHTIPERCDQQRARVRRGARGGRPPKVDPERYRRCNVVERAIARLKQHRAIATRYDKLAASYRTWLVLAALLLWLPT